MSKWLAGFAPRVGFAGRGGMGWEGRGVTVEGVAAAMDNAVGKAQQRGPTKEREGT